MSRVDAFKREVLNLPNMITIGRIFLIPPVLLLIDQRDPYKNLAAMCLFLFASLLDVVDGWLARRQGLVTFFGKFMDPLADKIMAMALLIYLATEGRIDPWVVVVLLSREFYISGLRTLAISEGIEIVAGAGGKAKTAFQMIGISFVLLYFSYEAPFWGGMVDYHRLGLIFIYVSLVASIWSAITYTISFGDELGKRA